MVEEVILDAEERMSKALDHLREEMRGMRTGRAHPGLVESIRVDYYGTPTPLKQLANISVPEPDQLVIKPFDVSAMSDIEKGIQSSDLGITPQNSTTLKILFIIFLAPTFIGRRQMLRKLNFSLQN